MMQSATERVLAAIDAYRRGEMVILVDDEDRENEGDLCVAAEKCTPEVVNFMAKEGRGLICLAMDEYMVEKLKLAPMVQENEASLGTAFTVSIEARHGVTTGISARDRARTIEAAIADDARPEDLVSPGHVFPLRARRGGVLVRTGQTEGSVDLSRLSGLKPASVICEIMKDDGEMARMPDLEEFAETHGLMILTVADLIAYRLQQELIVERRASGQVRPALLSPGEPFAAHAYKTLVQDAEYLALVRGDVRAAAERGEPVLVRVQSVDPVGDTFGLGERTAQLRGALNVIDEAGVGVFLYVYPHGRTSVVDALSAHLGEGQRSRGGERVGHSEVLRDFGLGAQVLSDLGCRKIRLLSNNTRRIVGLDGFGIEVVERVEIPVDSAEVRRSRLRPIRGEKTEVD